MEQQQQQQRLSVDDVLSLAGSGTTSIDCNFVNVSTVSDNRLDRTMSIMSYNMHGFNCGHRTVRDYILQDMPDIFLLQEHWLTPANLIKFDETFPQYFCFGSSAMNACVQKGVLRGRPFGGVMTLINRKLKPEVICAAERHVIVAVGNLLIINVYLPCAGSNDRNFEYEDVLNNLVTWLDQYPNYSAIIGGDFNTDLDRHSPITTLMNDFIHDNGFYRCDSLFVNNDAQSTHMCTYFNEALGVESNIDYFVVNKHVTVLSSETIDPYINLSDHRPIVIRIKYEVQEVKNVTASHGKDENCRPTKLRRLRWDHADLDLYRSITGANLSLVYEQLKDLNDNSFLEPEFIDDIYHRITDILLEGSDTAVPSCHKNFLKFWWDDDLDELKEKSIASCQIWKAAGKPRSGPIFAQFRKDKAAYKHGIKTKQRAEKEVYTNDLHEALLKKQGKTFWNCWASKFESSKKQITHVDGITDPSVIAKHFVEHFAKVCANNTSSGAARLENKYRTLRAQYTGMMHEDSKQMDTELVESVIRKLKFGKAAGLDGITTEHLKYCHAILPCILSKLFNLMLANSHVPTSFGQSYTVPVIKGNCNSFSKTLTVDDFRGVSISPVLSKVFEHCILDKFGDFLTTSDNQFGFKRHSGCAHAIYTLRSVIDYYVSYGSTVNLCSIDLSKAFDKMNHHGLFIKLMERHIPANLLLLLENWFAIGVTCVKWDTTFSGFVRLLCGIRQGGVLSPYLFAVFIDSIVDKVRSSSLGCYVKYISLSILLYADDIVLLSPSVSSLQKLLEICESELLLLDMSINVRKSHCLRIGPRFNVKCDHIVTSNGIELEWCNTVRYLGIYITSARTFSCTCSHVKQSAYRAFNSIFGKVGRIASDEVIVQLFKSKCLPILYYGIEVCPYNKSQISALQYVVTSCFGKIFNTRSKEVIDDCMLFFNCPTVSDMLSIRKCKFLNRYSQSNNLLCKIFTK